MSEAAVRQAVDALVKEKGCGPILVRLAWHDAGTFCSKTKTGGPRGAMRFGGGECKHAANAGLQIARDLLQPIVDANKQALSVADIWALAGSQAIETMGGPHIPFKAGRKDAASETECVEEGRLPDATQAEAHLRDVFGRMGFTDREIVALSGAHTVGKCHPDRSGFVGPWGTNHLKFDNEYFQLLMSGQWMEAKAPNGNKQYTLQGKPPGDDVPMMLETDICLIKDPAFKPVVEEYAKDQAAFFKDFVSAWKKLTEAGM